MEFIRQQEHGECLLACVAMLAGRSLEEVKQWVHCEFEGESWRLSRESLRLLCRAFSVKLGQGYIFSKDLWLVPFFLSEEETYLIIYVFDDRDGVTRRGHAVLFHGGSFYDPAKDRAISLEEMKEQLREHVDDLIVSIYPVRISVV